MRMCWSYLPMCWSMYVARDSLDQYLTPVCLCE